MSDQTRASVFIEVADLLRLADKIESERSPNRDGEDLVDACNVVLADVSFAIREFVRDELARARR